MGDREGMGEVCRNYPLRATLAWGGILPTIVAILAFIIIILIITCRDASFMYSVCTLSSPHSCESTTGVHSEYVWSTCTPAAQ